jgi:hypothetical protein
LQKALAQMFAQDLNYSPALCVGEFVPLEIPAGVLQRVAQFIALQLVGGEQPDGMLVLDKDLIDEFPDRLHRTELVSLFHAELSPVWKVRCYIALIDLWAHAQFLIICGDSEFDLIDNVAGVCKQFFGLV